MVSLRKQFRPHQVSSSDWSGYLLSSVVVVGSAIVGSAAGDNAVVAATGLCCSSSVGSGASAAMITTGRHRPGAGGSRGSIKSAGMLLQPSSIHFLSDHNSDIMSHVLSTDIERNITDISRKIVANGDYPKIQAVEKDGNWFTLNNSQLELCRRLEREGCCQRVKVDVVSITEVPIQLRGMMVLPRTDATLPTDVREAGTVEGVRPAQDPATEPPSLSKTVTGPEQQAQPDVEG